MGRFDDVFVAGVDEDVVLALFEPPEDEGLVVVVLFPILEYPSNPRASMWPNHSQNPKTITNLENEAPPSKKNTKLQEINP